MHRSQFLLIEIEFELVVVATETHLFFHIYVPDSSGWKNQVYNTSSHLVFFGDNKTHSALGGAQSADVCICVCVITH